MKKILAVAWKGVVGMMIGEFISMLILIIISLCAGDGNFHPVAPELQVRCGSEIAAVVVQFVVVALMGAGIGLSMLVWESERLGLVFQTLIHFAILLVCFLSAAWICWWIPHTVSRMVLYCVGFVCIYIVIWLAENISAVRKIKAINARLH